jgi:hypothetical protein
VIHFSFVPMAFKSWDSFLANSKSHGVCKKLMHQVECTLTQTFVLTYSISWASGLWPQGNVPDPGRYAEGDTSSVPYEAGHSMVIRFSGACFLTLLSKYRLILGNKPSLGHFLGEARFFL